MVDVPQSGNEESVSDKTPVSRWFNKTYQSNTPLRIIGFFVIMLSLICAGISFAVLTGVTDIKPSEDVATIIWLVNGLFILIVLAVLITEAALLIRARLGRQAGSGLHMRMVGLFAIVAVIPAIVVAFVAATTLNRGLDQWLSERNQWMVESSRLVAKAYLEEHADVLRNDILAVANTLEQSVDIFEADIEKFQKLLDAQAVARSLPFTYLLDGARKSIMRAQQNKTTIDPLPPAQIMSQVSSEAPLPIAPGTSRLIGSIIKLKNYDDLYLFVARYVDQQVLEYVKLADQNITEFRELSSGRWTFQIAFALIYASLTLALLLAAVWTGVRFANGFIAPIGNLMIASNRISRGDLDVAVPLLETGGDMRDLTWQFNTMADQLKSQRFELLQANETIDQRRQFTEAVVEGVSAGILGLDPQGQITLANGRAMEAFGLKETDLMGRDVGAVVPELSGLIANALSSRRSRSHDQVNFSRGGVERTYQVRLTREGTSTDSKGYVMTLDDISDLVAAQRTSAWADVARRIAHEIKNPLTPIQLSAERLKRRYGKKLQDDIEVFEKCTDTIIRQVGDIGRMVDEFSSFARMPSAVMAVDNLSETIRESVFLITVSHPDIELNLDLPDAPMIAQFDRRLISQAVANLVKNAAEAIEGLPHGEVVNPVITVQASESENGFTVLISDNGKGWPEKDRARLLEPYMTTRDKGTGLGLAIVAKIIEQHMSTLELVDAVPDKTGRVGAAVRFFIQKPVYEEDDIEAQSGLDEDKNDLALSETARDVNEEEAAPAASVEVAS